MKAMLRWEPLCGLLENVFGMAPPESKDDGQSPLLRFLKEVSERLPNVPCGSACVECANLLGILKSSPMDRVHAP